MWQAVQDRLDAVRQSPRSNAIRKREFWRDRRPRHLLTGLVHCGRCGSKWLLSGAIIWHVKRHVRAPVVTTVRAYDAPTSRMRFWAVLKDRLMAPEHVEAFIAAFNEEINRQRQQVSLQREEAERRLKKVADKLEGLYDAIADGLRTDINKHIQRRRHASGRMRRDGWPDAAGTGDRIRRNAHITVNADG